MPKAQVDRDALMKSKKALKDFKTDVETIPDAIVKSVQEVDEECVQQIKELEDKISEVEDSIKKSVAKKNSLEDQFSENKNIIENNESKIHHLRVELESINDKIRRLHAQRSQMQSEMSRNDSEGGHRNNSVSTDIIDRKIQDEERRSREVEREIISLQDENNRLDTVNKRLQSEIRDLEDKIYKLRREKARLDDIFERMKASYKSLKYKLEELSNSTKSFSYDSITQMGNNIAGVDECIQRIDEYISTNI